MKKILMLGGADIQVSAIKKAKELGYYVITCDYLPNNPGHKYADEYHNVSTTDIKGVYKLAKKLKVDGIMGYASDPAAPTVAYVAEKLGLPSNPYDSVITFFRKDLFRAFLKKNHFNVPRYASFKNYNKALSYFKSLKYECIIKPIDSSGSKGVTKLNRRSDFKKAFELAMQFSKTKSIIIEEFIERKNFFIGGEGFIVDGRLVFWCTADKHFSETNALLPKSVSVPSTENKQILHKIKKELQRLIKVSGLKFGPLNIEVIVDKNEKIYIVEVGPRNGGNMIPELTYLCTGIDIINCSIKAALGEKDICIIKPYKENKYFSHFVIHAEKDGIVRQVKQTDKIKKHLIHYHQIFKIGDKVKKYLSSADRLGIMLLKYKSKKEMLDIIYHMDKYFYLSIK